MKNLFQNVDSRWSDLAVSYHMIFQLRLIM